MNNNYLIYHKHLFSVNYIYIYLILLIFGCNSAKDNSSTNHHAAHADKINKYHLSPNNGDEIHIYEINSISIYALLANPTLYDGKIIKVDGIVQIEFEGTAIYPTHFEADYLICESGFWVEFNKDAIKYSCPWGPKEYHNKCVMIEGIFDSKEKGHKSLYAGAIKNITRIEENEYYGVKKSGTNLNK
jgi:hypothetical protein